ncbi:MAG: hypothetical protein KatS3mg057_1049 [Herpetosiphonaceae bacterium]|nr:MAG: hypothetical protein KatS3mg057_1049 [Herpetosiphonaceae bacterium]
MDLGLLILRVLVGALFIGHGLQKLFGLFGGHGIEGTAGWLESIGLRPGRFWARLAGLLEFGGGALLALGLLNPIGPLAIIAVMLMAIAKVHATKGLWITNGGYEYNLVLMAIALLIALAGQGQYALDALLGVALPVIEVFVVGLAIVIVGILLGLRSGQLQTGYRGPAQAAR